MAETSRIRREDKTTARDPLSEVIFLLTEMNSNITTLLKRIEAHLSVMSDQTIEDSDTD